MTNIELSTMHIISSALPRIAGALERIATALEPQNKATHATDSGGDQTKENTNED